MRLAKEGRTQTCGVTEARVRAAQARKFLETAELILDVDDDLATPGVAAALAVLAGIAASDALCCRSLGRRARGQDHREAIGLLAQVEPNGKALSRALARLLDIKDGSQYGLVFPGYRSRKDSGQERGGVDRGGGRGAQGVNLGLPPRPAVVVFGR